MQNKLIIIFGPSGSGKTSVTNKLNELYEIPEIISITTRKPRNGEINGIDYNFISRNEVHNLNTNNQLAEIAIYNNEVYGITKEEIENKLFKNRLVSVVTNLHGLNQLRNKYPNQVFLVHLGADYKTLKDRLINRGDSYKKIRERTKTIEKELANWIHADLCINTSTKTIEEVAKIIYDEALK